MNGSYRYNSRPAHKNVEMNQLRALLLLLTRQYYFYSRATVLRLLTR